MWKLIRKRDGLIRRAPNIKWIKFDEKGRYKQDFDNPRIGLSLLLSPFNIYFTWMTTLITEIIEQKDDYIHFKTENSEYKLVKENMIDGIEADIYNDLRLDKYLTDLSNEDQVEIDEDEE